MSDPAATLLDTTFLSDALRDVFAPWVRELELRVLDARAGDVRLALPVTARHVHAGNVMSGQTLMAAADTAMVLAVMVERAANLSITRRVTSGLSRASPRATT